MKPTRLAGSSPVLGETRLAEQPPVKQAPKLPLPLLGAAAVTLLAVAVGMSVLAARHHHAPPATDNTVSRLTSGPPAPSPPAPVEEEAIPPPLPPPLQGSLPGDVPGAAGVGGGRAIDLGQAAGAPSTQPGAGSRSIRAVRTLFIEAMSNHLDDYIRAEIAKQMPTRLTVVSRREDANAVMTGTSRKHGGSGARLTNGYLGVKDEFSGTVTITDPNGGRVLWTSEAGDKAVLIGVLKRGGPKRVAERLVSKLRKAMERK
jgi:hypothetical protein